MAGGRNYQVIRAVNQAVTMHSLHLMHLTDCYPSVSFLHVHPGWVATDFLSSLFGSGGTALQLLGRIVAPLYRRIAMTEEESGQRQLFNTTSQRYPSRTMIISARVDTPNVAASHKTCSGFYRVLWNGETSTDIDILGPLEGDGFKAKVAKFTGELVKDVLENGRVSENTTP
jgi:hypothetical protein